MNDIWPGPDISVSSIASNAYTIHIFDSEFKFLLFRIIIIIINFRCLLLLSVNDVFQLNVNPDGKLLFRQLRSNI